MRISDWSSDVCSSDLPSNENNAVFCEIAINAPLQYAQPLGAKLKPNSWISPMKGSVMISPLQRRKARQPRDGKMPLVAMQNCTARVGIRLSCGCEPPAGVVDAGDMASGVERKRGGEGQGV